MKNAVVGRGLVRSAVGSFLVLAAAFALPAAAHGQMEVTAGVMVADQNAPDGARVAPLVSLAIGTDAVGFPLILEAGFARADFTSFGEAFHRNHGYFVLGSEWTPVRSELHVGLRLGVGGVVEDDISEDDPGFRSSNNWAEAVVPGLVIKRPLASGREFVFTVSDHVMYPIDALFDPSEYSVEHRFRILFGVRF